MTYCITASKKEASGYVEVGHSKMTKSWKTLKGACRNAYLLLEERPDLHVSVVKTGTPDRWSILFYMTFQYYVPKLPTGVVFGTYTDPQGYSHNERAVIIVRNGAKVHGSTVRYQALYEWTFDTKMSDVEQLFYITHGRQ